MVYFLNYFIITTIKFINRTARNIKLIKTKLFYKSKNENIMKIIKSILIVSILTVLSIHPLHAQSEIISEFAEKSYVAYQKSSTFMWKQLAIKADQVLESEERNKDLQLAAFKIKYGFLYNCLSNQDEETYELHLQKTLEQLEKLMIEFPSSSSLYSLSAAIMSIQMAFSPMKGMTLGSLSAQHINKAIALDSLSALAWRQYASSKYYTPKMWGGDIEEAIAKFKHSVKLYEDQKQIGDWTYLDALAGLGMSYQKAGNIKKARKTYEKALQIAPDFNWVKNYLLPSLSK